MASQILKESCKKYNYKSDSLLFHFLSSDFVSCYLAYLSVCSLIKQNRRVMVSVQWEIRFIFKKVNHIEITIFH